MREPMSLKTLLKLEANPAYKLSDSQKAQLDEYRRTTKFKNNPDFAKHSTEIKNAPRASELKNAKKSDSN